MATEIGSPASDSKTEATGEDAGSVELPAPEGWKKKAVPRKASAPGIKMAVFISPTGEEITNKRQLNQYLRAHPGGPPSSEFDWGTGDTPRRSSRIGAKAKATESPEEEKPPKKQRKSTSSTKKKKEDKKDDETANASDESKKEVKDTEESTKDSEQSEKPVQPPVHPAASAVVEGKEEVKPEDEHKETEKKSEDTEMMTESTQNENAGKKIKDINMIPEGKKDKDSCLMTGEAIKDEKTEKKTEDSDGKAEDENKEKDKETEEKNKESCLMTEEAIKEEKTEKKVEDSDMLPEGKQVDNQEDESKEKGDGFNVLPERNENAKENETVEVEKAKAEAFAPESVPERKETENAAENKSDDTKGKETMEIDQTGEFKPVVQQPQTSVN